MPKFNAMDALVRARLRQWPQVPPGQPRSRAGRGGWLRGRPCDESVLCHPFLKFPGSNRLRTLPDGLWLNFAGTALEPFVDIFAIEACSTLCNLLDKRSRFAPSTHSLLAYCPTPWLLAPITSNDPTPRWLATGVLRRPPDVPLVLPVRDIRVLYALRATQYNGFLKTQIPHPHEYFMPMDVLVAKDADQDPALRALVSRASASANFLTESRAAAG